MEADFQPNGGNLKDKWETGLTWGQALSYHKTKVGTKIKLAYTFPYYITYAPNGWGFESTSRSWEEDLARPEVKDAKTVKCRSLVI